MKRRCESGQAMIELTVMLLAFAAMILGVVILGGIEISGNKLLLSARYNAQRAAVDKRGDSSVKISGSEYVTWSYPSVNLKKKYRSSTASGTSTALPSLAPTRIFRRHGNYYIYANRDAFNGSLKIPFTLSGTGERNPESSSINSAGSGFSSFAYSDKYDERGEQFNNWKPLSGFSDRGFQSDFAVNAGVSNALDAANLLSASGSSNDSPATLRNSDQAGAYSADNALYVMYETFEKLFGIRINKLRLSESPANRVYMPVLK